MIAQTTAEVADCVRIATERAAPIVPRGSGAGPAGAAVPALGGVVVVLMRMNRILELDPKGRAAAVPPRPPLDVLEFVAAQRFAEGWARWMRMRRAGCGYPADAQGIREAPREILGAIRECGCGRCVCLTAAVVRRGSIRSRQREMSQAVLQAKPEDIATRGAGVLATSNPGCTPHLAGGTSQSCTSSSYWMKRTGLAPASSEPPARATTGGSR